MHLCPQELQAALPVVTPILVWIIRWWTGRRQTMSPRWRGQERQLRHRNEFEGVTWTWPVKGKGDEGK